MNELDFSILANTLYPFCGDGGNKPDFVITLTDNFMEEPQNEADEQKSLDGEYNPLTAVKPDSLKSFFNGSRKISVKNATFILGRMDKNKFEDYITKFSPDTLNSVCAALGKHGITADLLNVGKVCADLLEAALRQSIEPAKKNIKEIGQEEFTDEIAIPAESVRIPAIPLANVFIRDGKIHIGGAAVINLPEKLIPPDEVLPTEMGYVPKLFEAYSDDAKPKSVTQINLVEYPKYRTNFNEQREHYFNAIYVMERVRGVFAAEDGNQFEILKKETYDGISEVYREDYISGYIRLNAVLKQTGLINMSKSLLANIPNLVGISEKKGVCHILVSEGVIPSWVEIYG